jgi:outer membrane lipoprotein-sorting protein
VGRSLIYFLIALFTAFPLRGENTLNGVKKTFASITSFTAAFSQMSAPAMGDTQRFEGTIDLSRPSKVWMEISSPERQLIVYNGDRAWLYLPEENICYVYSSLSIGNLSRLPEYIFDPFEKLTVDTFFTADTHLVISFTARDDDPFVEKVDLTVSNDSFLPQEIFILDRSGNRITYVFSRLTINETEKGSFTFTPPSSAEIIEH